MVGKTKLIASFIILLSTAVCLQAVEVIDNSGPFPVEISNPGSYIVVEDLTPVNKGGIVISVDNVTIDFQGHNLRGDGSFYIGIQATGTNLVNITIRNGTVSDFGNVGILFSGYNIHLEGMKVKGGGDAGFLISLFTSDPNTNGILLNCMAYENKVGFCVNGVSLQGCSAYQNHEYGIYASESTLSDCRAVGNKTTGFNVANGTMMNCVAFKNETGISLGESTAVSCLARNNRKYGFRLMDAMLKDSNSINNGMGILVHQANYIQGNTIRNNEKTGLAFESISTKHNYIIQNALSGNTPNINSYGPDNYVPLSGDNVNMMW